MRKKIIIIGLSVIFAISIVGIFTVPHAHAALMEPVWKMLKPKAGCGATVTNVAECFDGMGKVTAQIWQVFMNIFNSIILAVLIFVAFMNILRIQLDSYAVKKILPAFIMAVILANFSWLIARIVLDAANIVMGLFLAGDQVNNVNGAFDSLYAKPAPASASGDVSNLAGVYFTYLIKQILIIVGSVFIMILSFVFLIRNFILYFLVAISPMAFFATILPSTKKYFQQWWGQFAKWVFMPVIAVFWLWLAGQFMGSVSTGEIWILPYAFAIFCYYMAITSPFKAGGAAVGAWSNFGKKAWGRTGGAAWNATGGVAVKSVKQWGNDKYSNIKRGTKEAALKRNLFWSRNIVNKGKQGQLRQRVIDAYYNDQDKQRNQEAFLGFINSREFKRAERQPDGTMKSGFQKPVMGKLKGQARELFVDDEWNREVYAGRANVALMDAMPMARDRRTGAILGRATLEQMADRKNIELVSQDRVTGVITAHGNDKDRVKAAKEAGAALKELQQRRRGARNVADDRTGTSADPWANLDVDTLIRTQGLDRLDPRVMASSAVPGQQNTQPTAGAPAAGQPGQVPLQPPPPPNHGPADAQGNRRESLGDIRRRQQREAAEHPAGGQAGGSGEGSNNAGRPGDFGRMEELLEQILDATEQTGKHTEEMAAGVSKTASGPNVGVGIASLPEVKGRFTLENLSPQAKAELGILQDRANQRANVVRQRLETKQAEQQLRALRDIGENEEEIINEAQQGKKELNTGEVSVGEGGHE